MLIQTLLIQIMFRTLQAYNLLTSNPQKQDLRNKRLPPSIKMPDYHSEEDDEDAEVSLYPLAKVPLLGRSSSRSIPRCSGQCLSSALNPDNANHIHILDCSSPHELHSLRQVLFAYTMSCIASKNRISLSMARQGSSAAVRRGPILVFCTVAKASLTLHLSR